MGSAVYLLAQSLKAGGVSRRNDANAAGRAKCADLIETARIATRSSMIASSSVHSSGKIPHNAYHSDKDDEEFEHLLAGLRRVHDQINTGRDMTLRWIASHQARPADPRLRPVSPCGSE